jgi:EF-P beta-lysylation protein EpmB
MIAKFASSIPVWQRELANAVSDPAELLSMLDLDPALLPGARAAAALFPLRVLRSYVARMNKGDPGDPLLRQILPLTAETLTAPGYLSDPVGDLGAMKVPGLLHKYHGRALLITTAACGVHCRYCFRREFPYQEANSKAGEWQRAVEYLAADHSVSEVILSGGDPLCLSNGVLAVLLEKLAAIDHLQRVRIHSRLPVVLPQRVDRGLLELLAASRPQVVVVLHANHPREVDASVAEALIRLAMARVALFNQAVLLKGVNDSVEVLAELSDTLFRVGVIPYYLHLMDRVRGASHFEVEESRTRSIMEEMRNSLPGYLVPRLVREQAGRAAKILVA